MNQWKLEESDAKCRYDNPWVEYRIFPTWYCLNSVATFFPSSSSSLLTSVSSFPFLLLFFVLLLLCFCGWQQITKKAKKEKRLSFSTCPHPRSHLQLTSLPSLIDTCTLLPPWFLCSKLEWSNTGWKKKQKTTNTRVLFPCAWALLLFWGGLTQHLAHCFSFASNEHTDAQA